MGVGFGVERWMCGHGDLEELLVLSGRLMHIRLGGGGQADGNIPSRSRFANALGLIKPTDHARCPLDGVLLSFSGD